MPTSDAETVNIPLTLLLCICLILPLKSHSTQHQHNTANQTKSENVRSQYERFLQEHQIKSISPMEKEYRFRQFIRNKHEVDKFNRDNPDIKLKLNDFALLTKSEFRKSMTNPDFLFLDKQGHKHHVNVNDPVNEEVIDREIDYSNRELLQIVREELANPNLGLGQRSRLKSVQEAAEETDFNVKDELRGLHRFLQTHHVHHNSDLLSLNSSSWSDGAEEYIQLARDTVDEMLDYHGKAYFIVSYKLLFCLCAFFVVSLPFKACLGDI